MSLKKINYLLKGSLLAQLPLGDKAGRQLFFLQRTMGIAMCKWTLSLVHIRTTLCKSVEVQSNSKYKINKTNIDWNMERPPISRVHQIEEFLHMQDGIGGPLQYLRITHWESMEDSNRQTLVQFGGTKLRHSLGFLSQRRDYLQLT